MAPRIAELTGARTVVELGLGSMDKTWPLPGALRSRGTLRSYVGVDVSESAIAAAGDALVAAYNDSAGVAAAFDKNVLAILNARLGADFDLEAFDHVAAWVPEAERVEMRLRSAVGQRVRVPGAGLTVCFAAGEEMRTEIAAKFRRDGVDRELAAAGLAVRAWWTDPASRFAVSLSVPA